MRLFYKNSDKIIGISRGLSKDLSKMVNKKVLTIYNPAADKILINKIKNKQINLKIYKNKRIILNVGFLEIQKDQITLLRAFNTIKNKIKNLHLIIIGTGSEYYNIKNFINKNDLSKRVTIFNNILNPTVFYKMADLFVFTSIYEGFGNVIVEALINKCPVISSNCNSGPSEILENGKYGKLFPVKNDIYLSKLILKHFNNTSILKKKALKFKFNNKYNLKTYIERYDGIFKKI